MKYDIFISYRRSGGKFIARTLKESLKAKGYNVFLDYDNLTDGHFDERILSAIESAPIFMLILSEGCLDRCHEADDWVRKEIELALTNAKHIIPINPDKEFSGFPSAIPDFIRTGIGQHQFSVLDKDQLYNESLEKVIRERISPILPRKGHTEIEQIVTEDTVPQPTKKVEVKIHVDETCELFVNEERACKIKKDNVKTINVPLGKINVSFHCLSLNLPNIDQTIQVTEDLCPNLDISFQKLKKELEFKEKEIREKQRIARQSFKTMSANYEQVDNYACNGLTLVKNFGCYGYLDEQGFEVIPCIYESATRFSQGLASVCLNGSWSVIDSNGIDIPGFESETPVYFHNSLSTICQNGKYGLISSEGEFIIPCTYDNLSYPSDKGLLIATTGQFSCIINLKNQKINPIPYDSIEIKTAECPLIIDLNAHAISKPEFPCFVVRRGLYGTLSDEGKQVVPCVIESFGEGKNKGIVKAHGKFGFIDIETGRIVIPIEYAYLSPSDYYLSGGSRLYYAAKDGSFETKSSAIEFSLFEKDFFKSDSFGLIDDRNNTIIPFEYNAIYTSAISAYAVHSHCLEEVKCLKCGNDFNDTTLVDAFFSMGCQGLTRILHYMGAGISDYQIHYSVDTYKNGIIEKTTKFNGINTIDETNYHDLYNQNSTNLDDYNFMIPDDFDRMFYHDFKWEEMDGLMYNDENYLKKVNLFEELERQYKIRIGIGWEKALKIMDAKELAILEENGKKGLLHLQRKMILVPAIYDEILVYPFYERHMHTSYIDPGTNNELCKLPSNLNMWLYIVAKENVNEVNMSIKLTCDGKVIMGTPNDNN